MKYYNRLFGPISDKAKERLWHTIFWPTFFSGPCVMLDALESRADRKWREADPGRKMKKEYEVIYENTIFSKRSDAGPEISEKPSCR